MAYTFVVIALHDLHELFENLFFLISQWWLAIRLIEHIYCALHLIMNIYEVLKRAHKFAQWSNALTVVSCTKNLNALKRQLYHSLSSRGRAWLQRYLPDKHQQHSRWVTIWRNRPCEKDHMIHLYHPYIWRLEASFRLHAWFAYLSLPMFLATNQESNFWCAHESCINSKAFSSFVHDDSSSKTLRAYDLRSTSMLHRTCGDCTGIETAGYIIFVYVTCAIIAKFSTHIAKWHLIAHEFILKTIVCRIQWIRW